MVPSKQRGIKNQTRLLWLQHSEWTRMAFTAVIFHNPNEEAVVSRLLRNPMDFTDFLITFFGWEFAFAFGELLKEHLSLAIALVRATIANDIEGAEKINKRLFANADEISALLAAASHHWHYDGWRAMLYRHLDLAKEMASEMIEGDYHESIQTYDNFEAEVMLMADMMSKGILRA